MSKKSAQKSVHSKYKEALESETAFSLLPPSHSEWPEKLKSRNKAFLSTLQAKTSTDEGLLYRGAALRFLNDSDANAGAFYGMPPTQNACKNLLKVHEKIAVIHARSVFEVAENVLKTVCESKMERRTRHHVLETAIHRISALMDKDKEHWPFPEPEEPKVWAFLAQAYFERSRTILPKGADFPQKKVEGLRKARIWAEKIKDGNKNVLLLLSQIYLETQRVAGDEISEKVIKDILFECVCELSADSMTRDEMDICLHLFEKDQDSRDIHYLETIMASDSDAPSFFKARAAFLKGDKQKVGSELRATLKFLKSTPFSHPVWEWCADFLVNLSKEEFPGWQDLAYETWKVCRNLEKKSFKGHILRWYWSRLGQLYDTAFTAVIEKAGASQNDKDRMYWLWTAAEIADSLKSLPTVRWMAVENDEALFQQEKEDKEGKEEWFENETRSIEDRYLINLNQGYSNPVPVPPPKPFSELPEPWLAVHFYVEENGQGHALIYDSLTKCWEKEEAFDAAPLWEAYVSWRTSYSAGPQTERPDFSETQMAELCKKLGENMGFLFDLPEDDKPRPVLFVPHRFLHMMPIHAACRNGTYFFTQRPSLYLPAWSLTGFQPDEPNTSNIQMLYKSFDDDDYAFDKLKIQGNWSKIKDPASPSDVLTLDDSPELMVILSHGASDPTNPFNCRLRLKNGDLRYLDIFQDGPMLNGTRVILGACETDMASPPESSLDEHLSLSTAFLQKGTQSVMGTLWEVRSGDVEEMVLRIRKSKTASLHEIVWEKQKSWIQNPLEYQKFYDIIPFRVIGYPS